MLSYIIQPYVLLFPVIIVAGIFLTQYIRVKLFSATPFALDVVSARRATYYILKFISVLVQVVGVAYLLKVLFAKLIDVSFSYPLLVDSTIQINEKTFLYTDLIVGAVLVLLGILMYAFVSRAIAKLDQRKNTLLDKVYLVGSKIGLMYLMIFPLFYAVYETAIYFVNEKFPAVQVDPGLGQSINVFQILDYLASGGGTPSVNLFGVKAASAPGESLGLALAYILALLAIKFLADKRLSAKKLVVVEDNEDIEKSGIKKTKKTRKNTKE